MKNILITGLTGFVGSHLGEFLLSSGHTDIHGTYLSAASLSNISPIKDQETLHQIDLTDYQAVESLIKELKPEVVFHLAALPSPAKSFKDPAGFLHNNIDAELYLLEAIRLHSPHTRLLIISSSEVYGMIKTEDLPIDENTPLRPVSPYGVSKIAQDYLALQYALSYQANIVRVRPFPHIGPRLSPDFASSAFAKKIAEIEKGIKEPILTVGNLEGKRDITDVRDIVRGYVLLVEKGITGDVYNLGSGISYKTKDILEKLLSLSTCQIRIQEDPALLRPIDIPEVRCDTRKMKELTGWEPEISLEQSLKDTLDYWRQIV